MNSLNIQLDSKLEQWLHQVAKLTQKTEQELITEALEKHLKELSQSKSCYDLAMELGVIGVTKKLPSDLSTNPTYFEGFGM
jgi:hypothetical protein